MAAVVGAMAAVAAVVGAKQGSVFRKYEYDVFCSFSNPDDKGFTDGIYEALTNARSRVFRYDDQREGKEDIMLELKKALELSKLSIIFLSKNYVSSKWCLDELVMILKSKRIFGQQFLPIFCDVDRSEVKAGNISETFGEEPENKVEERRKALREATEFAGLVLQKQADHVESSSIQKIIEVIEDKLKTTVGFPVVSDTIKGYIDRAADIDIIEAGAEVGLLNQEGEGPSSKETLEKPSFLDPVKSFLQCISDVTDIPLSVLEDRYAVGVLDLSNRSIESLPETISSLAELRQLLVRGDELLMELPSEIGALTNLKVLDLEGTELICLPKEIGKLLQLECLKVSLYRCADIYIERKGIKAIVPRGALSKLSRLKELSIYVDPDCEWWDAEANDIIDELSELKNLKTLKLYLPTDELLQQFLQLPGNVYTGLSNFRLIVGRHEPDIISCVPNDLQSEFEKSDKCLKYVNGEGKTDGIGKALEHAKALFLDRHWTIEKLSVFKIHEMHQLICCLVVECNEMNTIIDGGDFYQEGNKDNDRKPILELLHFLSIHHMKNLQCIWKGPIVIGCLSSLQILALHTCPELSTIFNPALLRNLINLKELIVKDCPKIKSLVSMESDLLESGGNFLPRLQNILLVHLPELVSISSGLFIAPKLQKIVVYNCPKLENLFPMDIYNKYMNEIKKESQWSKALDSSSNETDYLYCLFVHLMEQLTNSRNSLYQPSFENQAARTEGLVLSKDVLKEDKLEILPAELENPESFADKIEQGVAPYQYGMHRSTNVSIVSICGMSGSGKTTIAKSVYNSNYDKFEGSCFLSNIREYSRKPDGLVGLQAQLLSSILLKEKAPKNIYNVEDGILRIRNAVRHKRVLIVLDDVGDLYQLHALLGKRDWYCPGSKIIITTTQKQLLTGFEVHKVYEVKYLDDEESVMLFSLHAFGRDHPDPRYVEHTRTLVRHCCGLPLALVVLGSSLFGSSLSEYGSVIEKMELIPDPQVLHTLKVSFYSLQDKHDKDLFLHIACFFVGKDTDYVTKILDGCGLHAGIGIQTLKNRCLLTIDHDSKLRMHQLLQDMGRKIVWNESPKEPGKRSRLWNHEDALDVLRERTGRETIEGLILDFPVEKEPLTHQTSSSISSASGKAIVETNSFSGMEKLRLLQLNNVQLTGGYEEFPKELVWLCWRGFPLRSLPTDFPMENLVVLDVRNSSLKQVWEKTKFLPSLKILNLSHSHDLTCTPDFSWLPNLESLILKDCVHLFEVHESIAKLERLCLLNLKGCIKLRTLLRRIRHLRSLEKLVITGCSELLKQPEELESLTELYPQLQISKEDFQA